MNQAGIDTFGGVQSAVRAPDEEILSTFLKGDETMFAELVRRYEKPLYAFLCRMTDDPADAPDLFQETFVRVYRSAGSFQQDSRFKTWLYAIAANLCRSRLRKARGEATLSLDTGDFAWEFLSADAPGPNGLESEEIGRHVAAAVKELPSEQREVFLLRVYDEMSYAEIATTLVRPLGTVKTQMRLAVQRLRGRLHGIGQAYGMA
jgi:RNA polymerase sigma-70 factor (ECF subfamily)